MKHKNFIPKRIFILAIITIASICVTSAQRYRGFADFNAGFPITNSNGISFDGYYDYKLSAYSFGLSTSHGIQLTESFFLGAGVGINMNGNGEKINGAYSFPIFANVRYDFKSIAKTNFFVACKIGYLFHNYHTPDQYDALILNSSFDYIYTYEYSDWEGNKEVITNHLKMNRLSYFKNSFYIEPSIGLRIRLSNKIGFNISVYYLPIRMRDCTIAVISHDSYNPYDLEIADKDMKTFKNFTTHKIGVSIGIDF